MLKVNNEQNQVEIRLPNGETQQVNYHALIIATGASYVPPWRSIDTKILSVKERKEECDEIAKKIKDAKSVLCIGGGYTGIVSCSYIKESYPDKTVGICQRGKTLLPSIVGAH